MCKFIGIESVIANALIEKMAMSGKELSLKQIKKYGYEVFDAVSTTHERVIIIYEKDSISNFIINYSEYFHIEKRGEEEYIMVKEGIDSSILEYIFRCDLPLYIINAYKEKKDLLRD